MSNTSNILFALLAGCAAEAATPDQAPTTASETDPVETDQTDPDETDQLAAAKILIEHNATDEDTGFQGFVDGEPWTQLDIRDPDGKLTVSVEAKGNLVSLGLTELFFETNEPPNAEVPITEVLAVLPSGDYDFRAKLADGGFATGVATLSHAIPAGPVITSPSADAEVCADDDLVFRWSPVRVSITGEPVTITHYQLIVNRLGVEPGPGFGAETFSIHVPASVTTMRVPHEFLRPDADYEFEVLAIADSGNQTLSSGEFSTEGDVATD